MDFNETDLKEIVKIVISNLEQKPKAENIIEQNEKETLKKFEKMGYKIIKPFTKVLPIRKGKKKGEQIEYFGYVMKRDKNIFAKVFTTNNRNKLENVWA